jgi:energy-coupling factor transporter ATP-binding protein EcfA2
MFSYIKFTNIGPFRNFETKCGQAMLVTADNGEGKSTFLSAIRALLDDHNADLITIGEEEAEAYFEFTNGMTVRQTITKRGSKYDIRLPDGQKVLKRHKEFLQSLVTGIALDPMKLISCSKDERVDYLLSVLPITFQPEAIHEACGVAPPDTLTLEQFDNLLAAKESDRTEQNKRVDASKGLLSRLERSLPKYESDGKDWTAEASQLQSQRDKLTSDLQAFIKERGQALAAEVKAVATEARRCHRSRASGIRTQEAGNPSAVIGRARTPGARSRRRD